MRRVAWAVLLIAACGDEPAAVPRARLELAPIANLAVARLEREIATDEPGATTGDDPELAEQVAGLLATLSGTDEALKRVAREEIATLPSAVVALVAPKLEDESGSTSERRNAAEFLATLDTPAAAGALLQRVELARVRVDDAPWMRAQCAWRLGQTAQDWCVPRLILCLRYEKDHETAIWIARTLAHFGNYAGLEALDVSARTAPEAPLQASASNALAELAAEHAFADAGLLGRAWLDGNPEQRLPDAELSPRRQLEIWRLIAGFAEWQLRGVDDGRFVLSREHPRCAELLAQALHDENRYVRMHSAQCLERMGKRGARAGAALIAALDDADIAVQAALALGAVGDASGEGALVTRLAPAAPYELRVAAARALGSLGAASSAAALRPLLAEREPLDLRVAAACALLACDPHGVARPEVELVLGALTSGQVDGSHPEAALDAWLGRLAASGSPAARALRDAWSSIAIADPAARRAQRQAALASDLASLLP